MTSICEQKKDPVAIIGIGCRFPGHASDPRKFWKMLCEGADGVIEVPKDRWDYRRFYDSDMSAPGKMYVKKGGFLTEKWEDFDAEFFHISPREAEYLDPQQRLLLELTWEAMEDGGIVPENIRSSNTGVFIGGFTTDWQTLHNSPYNVRHCGMYSGINGSMTILSARLSHFFDLRGPCLTLDTACSSSLVAVHLACQNLWQKSCSLAIAGGINAMLIPETTIAMSKGRFLNPDGRCCSFDANAKGYVRGEGGGVVILKRLSDALRDKDPIYALIRGTGINHDGNTQGIAQPNPEAQKELMQKVLDENGINPWQVHYAEAHGTGTPIGDPAEAKALNAVLNHPGKRLHPCFVGAVKTNLGHLEAAAGVAGLIKTALCLKYKKIPPNLHFKTGNPRIPFEKYCLKIPTSLEDFPSYENTYYACVNSFGYGGTNSHIVLQRLEDSEEASQENVIIQPLLFPFSSKNQKNLKSVAKAAEQFVQKNPQTNLADIAYTLSRKRSIFEHRFSVSAQTIEELQHKLQKISKDEIPEGCARGKSIGTTPRLAFVYSGMGPQWWGMGRQLMESSPLFLESLKKCDKYLFELAGWSLLEELLKNEDNSRMEDPQVAQLANYAIQVSLTSLLNSWGIKPDAVAGHSIGEVAAAYASGAITLEEGILTTYHRSRIQSMRKNLGTMLAVGMGMEECRPLLAEYPGKISIAAVNSLNAVTLAGSKEDLMAVSDSLDKRNIFSRFLKVNIGYHSHQMDGLEEEVLDALSGLSPKNPSTPLFSTVFTDECKERRLDAHYWWKNIRQPVLFAQTLQNMIREGYQLFLEIGPHPVLSSFIKDGLQHAQSQGGPLATLNRNKPEMMSLLESLGGLYVKGYPLSWDRLHKEKGNFIRLPTYPWLKKTYWVESEESQQYRLSARQHPMLSRKKKSPNPTWQVEINSQHFPWLEDHQIDETIVFPAAAYVEAGIAIAGAVPCVLEDIDFKQLLTIQRGRESILQICLDEDSKRFKVHSLSGSEEQEWTSHASGKCCPYTLKPSPEKMDIDPFLPSNYIGEESVYHQFAGQGLEYGPAFRGIKKLWKKDNAALAEIQIPKYTESYHLHPALLDSALQTLIGTVRADASSEGLILPCRIDQIIFHSPLHHSIYCYARCTKQTHEKIVGDLFLCDHSGHVCVQIKGLECRVLVNSTGQNAGQLLYLPVWEEKPLKSPSSRQIKQQWLIGGGIIKRAEDFKEKNSAYSVYDPNKLQSSAYAQQLIEPIAEEENVHILLNYEGGDSDESNAITEIKAVNACVNLVKAIENKRSQKHTTLWIATRGTQSVGNEDERIRLEGSSLWGLCRVIRQEYPNIRCRLIDLDPHEPDYAVIFLEAADDNVDDEIAWRQQKRYAHKFKKKDIDASENTIALTSTNDAFALHLKTPGLIESLYYEQVEKNSPQAGEVGVQIHSSSLNFKDLMKVLGILDYKALEGTYFGKSFGMECAGTIVSVGPRVKRVKVGDAVCCFVPNTFQSYINVSVNHIYPVLPNANLDEAPIYIPFITVLRALKEIAKLKKGETILIHSATGAVGLAAIQYARFVGAKIIATAGSEEKRNYLRQIGVDSCGDSRSLSFVEDVKRWTEGRGVDVVLNSLSNDALTKSWSLLGPYGRFIEIGKRDISMNSSLPMHDFNRNTLFAAVDLDRTFIDQPRLIQNLLREANRLFKQGIFKPLPCTLFPAGQAIEAFQFMARSKHIGKILLKFDNQTVQGLPLAVQKPFVKPEYSYLITGGFSGFGLAIAQWLAGKGARHLILMARTGASSVEAQNAVEQLREQGVHVEAVSVDVANNDQLTRRLKECERNMPPLKGVIHSAMVLNDALISQLTPESIERVLMPKIGGCVNLHKCTSHYPLDFFVLFSSISSIIGNPGQGNYAAANAFLNSFCHYRKNLGLPALTISWGALKIGVLARDTKIAKHLDHHGIKGIRAENALKILEQSILNEENYVCALDINWQKIMQNMPAIKQSSVFSDFYKDNGNDSSVAIVEEVLSMDETKRLGFILSILKEIIGKTLKIAPDQLDEGARLNTLGVDSLMAMELHTMMEIKLGIRISSMELMKGPSIKHLAQLFLREISMLRGSFPR